MAKLTNCCFKSTLPVMIFWSLILALSVNLSLCFQNCGFSRSFGSFRIIDSHLFSLQKLIDDVSANRKNGQDASTIFVGGKGGVGKTTVSSALSVSLASDIDKDLKVLIVSTDPAHSLGDALDEDLRKSRGKPVLMTDTITGGKLYACEVDASAALEDFRQSLAAFDVNKLADAIGVSPSLLESLGLFEFSGLLNNPPPGLDELVALSNVMDMDSVSGDFDVVVVDTAPTGHTLRLLALPQFLDGFLGKLINLRLKLSGLASTLQTFLGDSQAEKRTKTIDDTVDRLEKFKKRMSKLRESLKDPERTKFVVVTVPTKLGVAESKRLIYELNSQGIAVTDVVVNQCVENLDEQDNSSALQKYYDRRKAGQDKWITKLNEAIDEVSSSDDFRSNGSPDPIKVTTIPFFDVELVGVPALSYVGQQCFADNPGFSHLMVQSNEVGPRVVICGGKGGVGKTTTSSSLAVSMAVKGHKVALISTDPAHSLGDAIDMNISGGELHDCPLVGVPPTEGSLSVLEIDPTSALNQFKGLVDKLVNGDESTADSGLKNTLRELQEVFDTLPAGTDEVVALAKIVNLVKKGGFDRIVLDTAPTGHTLRMLSTPGFLADLIERLLKIGDKINSNAAVKMFMSTRSDNINSATEQSKSTLLKFQLQMYDLEDMFADSEKTEFLIVTVPTELSVRESIRLLNDLTFESPDLPIKVRNIVVNQVLKGGSEDAKAFLDHVGGSQHASIEELEKFASSLPKRPAITKARYLDTEPRGVFGLRVLANELVREENVMQT